VPTFSDVTILRLFKGFVRAFINKASGPGQKTTEFSGKRITCSAQKKRRELGGCCLCYEVDVYVDVSLNGIIIFEDNGYLLIWNLVALHKVGLQVILSIREKSTSYSYAVCYQSMEIVNDVSVEADGELRVPVNRDPRGLVARSDVQS
jgi:hypothetical protein